MNLKLQILGLVRGPSGMIPHPTTMKLNSNLIRVMFPLFIKKRILVFFLKELDQREPIYQK